MLCSWTLLLIYDGLMIRKARRSTIKCQLLYVETTLSVDNQMKHVVWRRYVISAITAAGRRRHSQKRTAVKTSKLCLDRKRANCWAEKQTFTLDSRSFIMTDDAVLLRTKFYRELFRRWNVRVFITKQYLYFGDTLWSET